MGCGWLYAYLTGDLYIGKPLFVATFYMITIVPYLSIRQKKDWKKIALATFIFGVVWASFFDFIAEFTHSWNTVSLVFRQKILGVLPIDNLLGYVMMTLGTLVAYEHFVIEKRRRGVSPNFIFGLLLGLFGVAITLVVYVIQPGLLLKIPYPYLFMGLAAIAFPILLGIKRPGMIKKMGVMAGFFFVVYLVHELLAVDYKYWIYTGNNYVGWVTILERTFPFEEFFFWTMFYAASLVSYYEIFINSSDKIFPRLMGKVNPQQT